MRPDAIVIGGVLLALAGGAFLVVWLQKDDIAQETLVEALAGPQAPSTPPALAPASVPAPAPPQSAPRSLPLLFDFDRAVDPGAVRTSAKGELEAATGDACLDMGPEVRGNAGLVECLQADRRVEVTVIGGL